MNEIKELSHALIHQSRACYLTNVNRQRIHAYSIIAGLANIESRLASKRESILAKQVENTIENCIKCMKTTATTGKCYKCSKEYIEKFEHELNNRNFSSWNDMLVTHAHKLKENIENENNKTIQRKIEKKPAKVKSNKK